MAASGFTTQYSSDPVLLDSAPTAIHAVAPGRVPAAAGLGNDANGTRQFINDAMNSRSRYVLPKGSFAIVQRAALEPTLGPRYILSHNDRVVLQGLAAQIFDQNLAPVAKIGGLFGPMLLAPEQNLGYAPQELGLLAAMALGTGKYVYGVELMYGRAFERVWYGRRGNRLLVASTEKMLNPHADSIPDRSTIEVTEFKAPEGPKGSADIAPTADKANLIWKGQPLLVAVNGAQVVAAVDNHLFVMDWDLKIHTALQSEFRPLWMSLDEAGSIYLCVAAKEKRALWVVHPDGGRPVQVELTAQSGTLIAPPIVGYDHTIYLVSSDMLTAIDPAGHTLWARKAQLKYGGAVVTPDNLLVASDGPALVSFDHVGQRRDLMQFTEALVTAPLLSEHGTILVASAAFLYAISGR